MNLSTWCGVIALIRLGADDGGSSIKELEEYLGKYFEYTPYVVDEEGRYAEYIVDPITGLSLDEAFSRFYDEALKLNYYPLLMKAGDTVVIRVVRYSPKRKGRRGLLAGILLLATVVSVGVTGYFQIRGYNARVSVLENFNIHIPKFDPILGSVLFTLTVLVPILMHELGHFIIARRTSTPATFPLPIPAPIVSPLGTFGAIIQMRYLPKRMRDLAMLGLSGPVAGVILSIAFFTIAYMLSPTLPLSIAKEAMRQSLLAEIQIAPLATIIVSALIPTGNNVVIMSPIASAAFLILLIHFANLLPIGQLDGGHVFRSLTNTRVHRVSSYIVTLTLVFASFLIWSLSWLGFFAIFAFIISGLRPHIGSANTLSTLSGRDKLVFGVSYLVLLLLTMPVPVPQT